MEDDQIVELYWQRSEDAIQETMNKYGAYLTAVAANILADQEDSHEAVNDTYYRAWCTMPEYRPRYLAAYLTRLTRGFAIDIWRSRHRDRRTASEYACSLEELADVVSDVETTESRVEGKLLAEEVSRFLKSLPKEDREIFLGRYYFADSVKEIAGYTGLNQARIKHVLFKVRKQLKAWLTEEGYDL